MFRIKDLQKWHNEAKPERKLVSTPHDHINDYMCEQINRAKAIQEHAIKKLSIELGEAKEDSKIYCTRNLQLLDIIEKHKEREAQLSEVDAARADAEQRAKEAEERSS